ncbi:hypothetical protein OGAPHI_001604 [Ogataea philodendri]|uniref:Uncharacterized protein n=1 Tax=Ogataea philodendri TaxID=1378263 RepID=A0A9P8T7R7_9ASCO|nr:uncharacterized protein OGAPHI_001604 [Ogataea philodendri]KAH3669483.1 hypothetical protein OGAPHI_001604 [Ogataea philodendri]
MVLASLRPPSPVTALAQPLFITMAPMSLPPVLERTSLETCTGAANTLLVVKTAAAEAGTVDDRTDRSRASAFLTPVAMAPTLYPWG